MKKLIILLIVLLLVGCTGQKYTEHDLVAKYFLEEALSIEFDDYRNLTGTSGDLKISMKERYKLFEPYLSNDYQDEFERREIFWYGVWEVSGRQFGLVMNNLDLELNVDDEKEKIYLFKSEVSFDFEEGSPSIERQQQGELHLELSGKKWKVKKIKYSNDIFNDVVWP